MSLFTKKVPVVFQGETNECGLACLCMILNHYGNQTELSSLRGNTMDGRPLSLERLISLSESCQLTTRALRCELDDLSKLHLPVIAHVDFDHYVVIDRCSHNRVDIVDPASGRATISLASFSKRFTGIVVEPRPTTRFAKKTNPDRVSSGSFLKKLPVAPLAGSLLGLLLFSLTAQAFALVTPFFLQVTVDEVLLANNTELALVVVLSFAAVYVLSAITQSLRGMLVIRIGASLTYVLSAGLLRHTTTLPVRFFERRNIGDIVSRFGSMKPLQDFISESLVGICLDLLMITTTFLMISLYSLYAALYVLLLCVIYLVLQYLLTLPYRTHCHEQLIADARVQSHFIETIQAIDTIKRFEATGRRQATWLNHLVESLNSGVRARYWQLGAEIARYLFLGFLLLGVVYISIEQITLGILTIGMLYTLVAYSNHFAGALVSLTQEWQAYLMLSLHVQRVSDITGYAPDNRLPFNIQGPVSRIELRDLSFAHPDTPPLFHQLALSVSDNRKIAIIGPSGSGKSTLFALLRGELVPTRGQILINGRALNQGLNPASLFSTLQHNDVVLTGTVSENIAFLDPAPDLEGIVSAAQTALIHEDILRLPMAYQEKLSEQDCSLSMGQKQRLLIARALYRKQRHLKAEVLLLDEATSHLDQSIEHRVMQNVLSLPGICFFITHREEVAALADEVIDLSGRANQLPKPVVQANSLSQQSEPIAQA